MFKTTWKSYFKNNEKIPGNLLKSWKYHGNIMEFCQSEKVGTLCIPAREFSALSLTSMDNKRLSSYRTTPIFHTSN